MALPPDKGRANWTRETAIVRDCHEALLSLGRLIAVQKRPHQAMPVGLQPALRVDETSTHQCGRTQTPQAGTAAVRCSIFRTLRATGRVGPLRSQPSRCHRHTHHSVERSGSKGGSFPSLLLPHCAAMAKPTRVTMKLSRLRVTVVRLPTSLRPTCDHNSRSVTHTALVR